MVELRKEFLVFSVLLNSLKLILFYLFLIIYPHQKQT